MITFNKRLKLLAMAFDQYVICLIFPLRWACFPIKVHFRWEIITLWVHCNPTFDERIECYLTRIELFYFDDNFRRIALLVSAFRLHWLFQ